MTIFKPIAAVIVAASAFAGVAHADIIKPGPWPEIVKPEGHDSGECPPQKAKACKADMPRNGGPKEPNRAGA